MPKRLVLCCDGTWNTPDQESDGQPCRTNVAKLAVAVADEGADGMEQRVFYLRGVGTSRWDRFRGGAFGVGLSHNVKDTYRFLVENYEPGDEVFLFGFSRGAFTARSTAGFVRNAGVLKPQYVDRIDEAYDLYRDRTTHPRAVESQLFRRSFSHETRIRFIGVWDTVGALGIPVYGPSWASALNQRWQFHDTELSTSVDGAFHALAIDETRRPFEPTLWVQKDDAVDQRLEQVWFTGVHCDVGGGYPASGLSDIALVWMADRAREYGLTFHANAFGPQSAAIQPDPMARIHDSRSAVYRLQSPYIRPIGAKDPAHEYAASSAVDRNDRDDAYTPRNLIAYLAGPHQVMDVG